VGRGAAVGAGTVAVGKTAFNAEQPIKAVRRTIETERVNFLFIYHAPFAIPKRVTMRHFIL
jgi:hypothetical protein